MSAYNKARLLSPRVPIRRNDPSPPERPPKVKPPAEVLNFNPPGYDIPVAPMNLQRALLDGVDEAGTPGQVLTSRGPALAPVWGDAAGGGGGGTPGAFYIHQQTAPAGVWTIDHNLGFRPSTTLFDAAFAVFVGAVTHPTINQTVVTLTMPSAGWARLI